LLLLAGLLLAGAAVDMAVAAAPVRALAVYPLAVHGGVLLLVLAGLYRWGRRVAASPPGGPESDEARIRAMASIIQGTTDGVIGIDSGGRVTVMNERARILVGGGRDLTRRLLRDCVPEVAGALAESCRVALERAGPVDSIIHLPEVQTPFAVRVFPSAGGLALFFREVGAGGEPAGLPVSDRQSGNPGSPDTGSCEWFRPLFEQAAIGIGLIAPDDRFVHVNDRLCAVLGRDRSELLSRAASSFTDTAPDPATATVTDTVTDTTTCEAVLVERLLASGVPSFVLERPCRRGDGAEVWLRVTSSLVRIDGCAEACRLVLVEDITERHVLEAAVRTARDEAERASQSKTRFLAAASHDLRQPLQSLFFFTAALASHVGDDAGRQALRLLDEGLGMLKGLLDSLLDVSRLDAGLVEPVFDTIALDEVLAHIDAAYGPQAAAKGLAWRVDPCPLTVRTDRTLLTRMIRNLVENALRHTEYGGVEVICRSGGGITDASAIDTRTINVIVRDTGSGIAAEQLEAIFEEFHQVSHEDSGRSAGLGLGLAIVRRLSRLLRHPVAVKSTVGAGSEFRIGLPLGLPLGPVDAAADRNGDMATGGGGVRPDGRGRLAVLVDDDAIILLGLKAVLEDWGYEVLAAPSAARVLAGLDACGGRRPDMVIADYRLREGANGIDVVLKIRALLGENIPGVILTGETGRECQREAGVYGLTVVHKPVTSGQLGKALVRLMAVD
jgi:PAS domain S-box-containing protein